jgi:hypothetical protein
MVTSYSAGNTVKCCGTAEDVEDGFSPIVIARTYAGDDAGFAVDKTVDDNFEADETCDGVSHRFKGKEQSLPCWPS